VETHDRKLICIAWCAVWLAWAAGAAATSAGGGDHRTPLRVQVDRDANVYLDGVRVDTLLVCRRQWIHWEKRVPTDPDLSIQFERRLLHPRNPMRVRIASEGKPVHSSVDVRAHMRTYVGRPGEGFAQDVPANRRIYVRVVRPAER
jgi:hypothetical protein